MSIHISLSTAEKELVDRVSAFFGISHNDFVKKCVVEQSKYLFELNEDKMM